MFVVGLHLFLLKDFYEVFSESIDPIDYVPGLDTVSRAPIATIQS